MHKERLAQDVIELIASVIGVRSDAMNIGSGRGTVDRWDSLGHVGIMLAVEKRFKVRFSNDQLAAIHTVDQIVEHLLENGHAQ